MNDNAKAWVAALRSGKYEQGRGFLRDEDERFCCLGVACELAAEAGVIDTPKLSEGVYESGVYQYGGCWCFLPTPVLDWLGLSSSRGTYGPATTSGEPDSLARKNDYGASFEEIAALIEIEPKGLFA